MGTIMAFMEEFTLTEVVSLRGWNVGAIVSGTYASEGVWYGRQVLYSPYRPGNPSFQTG